jgi:type VI protein secretion system component VasF
MLGFGGRAPEAQPTTVPMHARSRRLKTMGFYTRKQAKEEGRRARRLIAVVKARRWRIVADLGALVLLFVEVGFFVGWFVRGRLG